MWFESYLAERHQRVSYQGHLSESLAISRGVPQGSILGPLFFIIFLNDMLMIAINSELEAYADDITLYYGAKDVTEINNVLSDVITPISKWLQGNELILNGRKSESMIIGTRPKIKSSIDNFRISNQGTVFTNVSSHKLLGIHFDNYLSWDTHVSYLRSKLLTRLYLFRRIKHCLPFHARMTFYNALVQPLSDYCCTVWGNCSDQNLERLHKVTKQFLRAILDVKKASDISSAEVFKKLNIKTIWQRVDYFKSSLVFKSLNNLAPQYMRDMFCYVKDFHKRNTRSSSRDDLYIFNAHNKSLKVTGSLIWNSLDVSIRNSSSIKDFKKNYWNSRSAM